MQNLYTCWSCHGAVFSGQFFCPACLAVQPVRSTNAFEILGVEISFDVDKNEVEKNYLDLQKKLHPDNFSHKTYAEQMHALSQSSALNDAYDKLTNNIKLSCELIEKNGVKDPLSSKPSPFLMAEQFELREALEEGEDLKNLALQVEEKQEICYNSLRAAHREKNMEEAVQKTIELRFLQKLMTDIKRHLRTGK